MNGLREATLPTSNLDERIAQMTRMIANATRYPAEILEPHADFEHDLGIDSVKLGEIMVLVREHYGLGDDVRIEPARFRTIATAASAIGDVVDTPDAADRGVEPQAHIAATAAILDEIVAIVAEATRYPADILEPHADFEHDLGIDSVKLGEIVVLVRRRYGLDDESTLDPARFRTIASTAEAIGEIVHRAAPMSDTQTTAAAAPPHTPSDAPFDDRDAIVAELTRIIAETTRYPAEILEPHADFEHDLGIDSVKLGEIIVVIRARYAIDEARTLDPSALRTIASTATAISDMLQIRSVVDGAQRLVRAGAHDGSAAATAAPRPASSVMGLADLAVLAGRNGGKPFLGRTVLVTGSGRGIGRDLALSLGSLGATVIVNAFHSRAAGEETAQDIRAAGGEAHFIWASVANDMQRVAMFDEIERTYGGLDFLICNASNGILTNFADISEDDWEKGFRTNVVGLHQMSLLAAKQMHRRGGGKIVTLSSTASYRHIEGFGCMGALKLAVESLTRTMAVEFERYNVAVTCLSPGPVDGELITKFPNADRQIAHWQDLSIGKQLVTNAEIANFVAFLLIGAVPSLNGSVIVFDNGLNYAL